MKEGIYYREVAGSCSTLIRHRIERRDIPSFLQLLRKKRKPKRMTKVRNPMRQHTRSFQPPIKSSSAPSTRETRATANREEGNKYQRERRSSCFRNEYASQGRDFRNERVHFWQYTGKKETPESSERRLRYLLRRWQVVGLTFARDAYSHPAWRSARGWKAR